MAARLSKSDYGKLSAAGKKKLSAVLGAKKTVSRAKKSRVPRAPRRPRAQRAVAVVPKSAPASAGSSDSPWHKGLASAGGTLIGGAIGGPVGAAIGGAAGKLFSAITGFGDYQIKENSLLGGQSPPMFESGQRVNVIEHREFIGDVTGSIAFQNTSFPINPGLFASFPWLAQVAANYEQYRINGMVYEFKSTAGDAISSTNNAMGTVIMATEYNSINPAFTNKSEMENYQFCTSAKPSVSFLHPIECAPMETTLSEQYIRTGEVPAGADKRFYDRGSFQIATQGMQANGIVIGELWVTYSITLIKPRIPSALSQLPLMDHYSWNSTELATVGDGSPFGTGISATVPMLPQYGSTIGTRIISGSVIQFPGYPSYPAPYTVGDKFMCLFQVRGPGGTTWTTPLEYTLGAAFSGSNSFDQNTTDALFLAGTTVTDDGYAIRTFERNGTAGTLSTQFQVTLAGTMPAAGTVTGCDLWIMQMNAGTQYSRSHMGEGKGVLRSGIKDTTEYRAKVREAEDDDEEELDERVIRALSHVIRKATRAESKEEKRPDSDDDDDVAEYHQWKMDKVARLVPAPSKKALVPPVDPVPDTPKKASRK